MAGIEKAVVLAAGRGTRMRELTNDLPKPMIEVRGKPVLQHIVEGLRDAGVRRFVVVVGYHAEAVRNFFGDGQGHNVDIEYLTQTVQDGTGRVVNLARSFAGDLPFILSYGDILISALNYKRIVDLPDECEAIIDDGVFLLYREPADFWQNGPSHRHNQGANLSFADGHCEHWKWLYPKDIGAHAQTVANAADQRDLKRLQAALPGLP